MKPHRTTAWPRLASRRAFRAFAAAALVAVTSTAAAESDATAGGDTAPVTRFELCTLPAGEPETPPAGDGVESESAESAQPDATAPRGPDVGGDGAAELSPDTEGVEGATGEVGDTREADGDGVGADAESGSNGTDDTDGVNFEDCVGAECDVTEDQIPEYVHEPAYVPRREEPAPIVTHVSEGSRSFVPEASLSLGHFAYQGVAAGLTVGASAVVVEHGEQTRQDATARAEVFHRRLVTPTSFALDAIPGDGVDAYSVSFAPAGVRVERRDDDDRSGGVQDVSFAPVSLSRARYHEEELDLVVALIEARLATRAASPSPGRAMAAEMSVRTAGFRHLEYTDGHTLNGVRALELNVDVGPAFGPWGAAAVELWTAAGVSGGLTIGARDGGLFTTRTDVDAHGVLALRLVDRLELATRFGFRAVVDARRDTVSGWYSATALTVSLP
ncbi:MAG: hypothetical protein H6698_06090 [Myxococcales bacterium]|nr:hypothetical protein [Myxococcales bacterium]MCB9521692.1 hypothetical protein [Myxococcales bacterium]MCB9531908.1 hypothetical protein [Myxococcales bacterium]MCB9533876.1 hypothetical protein [Myxococcales bacterium]